MVRVCGSVGLTGFGLRGTSQSVERSWHCPVLKLKIVSCVSNWPVHSGNFSVCGEKLALSCSQTKDCLLCFKLACSQWELLSLWREVGIVLFSDYRLSLVFQTACSQGKDEQDCCTEHTISRLHPKNQATADPMQLSCQTEQ